jgi:hypothetical protein
MTGLNITPNFDEDPWELVWGQPYIDADRLSLAMKRELLHRETMDFRTRLLIRDSVRALESFWGKKRFFKWLKESHVESKVQKILHEDFGEEGFHNIGSRLVANIKKAQLEQIFDILSRNLHSPVEVYIAGAITTLMAGLTARPTDGIDFVDDIPSEIRSNRDSIDQIASKYGFMLGHLQSHYLPTNWQARRQFVGDFGKLRVYFVDPYDIFVSKLASKKEKHIEDLRVLAEKLDKNEIKKRLILDGKVFLENQFDRATIEENWHFIFREFLFPSDDKQSESYSRSAVAWKETTAPSSVSYEIVIGLQQTSQSSTYSCAPADRSSSIVISSQQ